MRPISGRQTKENNMTAVMQLAARPGPAADATKRSRYRMVGIALALVGLMGAMVSVIGNFVAAGGIDGSNSYAQTLAWTFGLSIFSFGMIKIAIATILMGIVVRLWFRVDSIKAALARLHGHSDTAVRKRTGVVKTEYGPATVTDDPPKLLPIHRLAKAMWLPSLVMGAMALTVGLISSFVWANETPGTESFRQAAAWTQGVEFLGETFLLSGIAFLLGTILAGLRDGGGEVQKSLGIPVTTLKMPGTAKAFVVLMMMGMMAGIAQFVGYLIAIGFAGNTASFSTWLNFLGPFRELSLGLILAGIVLALVTIGNVLRFQFGRVTSIIRTGQ
jgi:MFS family permease